MKAWIKKSMGFAVSLLLAFGLSVKAEADFKEPVTESVEIPGDPLPETESAASVRGDAASEDKAPVKEASSEIIQGQNDSGEEAPGKEIQGQGASGEEAPGKEIQGQGVSGEEVPGEEIQGQEATGEEIPGEEIQSQGVSGEEATGEEIQSQEASGEEATDKEIAKGVKMTALGVSAPATGGDPDEEAAGEETGGGEEGSGEDRLSKGAAKGVVSTDEAGSENGNASETDQTSPSITLGDTVMDGSRDEHDENMGFVEVGVGIDHIFQQKVLGSWNYSAADDCLYMDNYQSMSKTLSTEGRGLRILAGGVNRLGTLSIDGDLEIVGSGIFLVDELELTEGSSVTLHANTAFFNEGEGSVALFVKQEDGTYLLVNGSLPGLLIDGLHVPDGVQLRMPENTCLKMESVYAINNGDIFNPDYSFSRTDPGGDHVSEVAAELQVSGLHMAQGAVLRMQGVCKLILTGSGSRLATVEANGTTTLTLGNDTQIETVNAQGDLKLRIGESNVIGNLSDRNSIVEITGNANIQQTAPQLTLTGTVKADLRLASGVLRLGKDCSFQGDLSTGYDGGLFGMIDAPGLAILDNRSASSLGGDYAPLVRSAGTIQSLKESYSGLVPGYSGGGGYSGISLDTLWKTEYFSVETWRVKPNVQMFETTAADYLTYAPVNESGALAVRQPGRNLLLTVTATRVGDRYYLDPFTISYEMFQQQELLADCQGTMHNIVELLMKNDEGELYTVYLRGSNDSISDGRGLCGIRILDTIYSFDPNAGGNTITSTSVSYTGTGVLGGSGAGSLGSGVSLAPSYIHTRVVSHTGDNGDNDDGNGDNGNGNGDNGNGDNGDNGNGDNGNGDDGNGDNGNENGDPEDEKGDDAEAKAEAGENLRAVAEAAGAGYRLRVFRGEEEVTALRAPVIVRMAWTMPESFQEDAPVYAVFRNPDGSLYAVRARWDKDRNELVFDSDRVGDFVVVVFPWDGEPFTEAFYKALAKVVKFD